MKMRLWCVLAFLALSLVISPALLAADSVTAKVEKIKIPTFAIGPGDPAPAVFSDAENYSAYPRTVLNVGTRAKDSVDVEYDMAVLENSLIRVEVNPAVGGRVWRIIDKKLDKNLLWTNDAVKPVRVGRRQGWLAGGIEFPFPVGNHGEDTMEPYRSTIRQNADGSATVTVSSFDHFYRFWGSYDITVAPDDARVAITCRLYNPTAVRNRYQIWVNAAVRAADDMQFIFPTDYVIGHGNDRISAWPSLGSKEDKSYWKNQKDQLGVFAWDKDFLGAYYHKADYGIIRYSSRKLTRGIKLWTWGTNSNWTREYSIAQGSYCELQGGRWPTQTMYGWLEPHEMDTWTEYWYPVKGIGGVDFASPYAAMKVDVARKGDAPRSASIAVNFLKDCRGLLTVASGGKTLLSESVNASAGDVVREKVDISSLSAKDAFTVSVTDAARLCVISYDVDLARTAGPKPAAPETVSLDSTGPEADALKDALAAELNSADLAGARESYAAITRSYPSYAPAWKALGILALKQTDYDASLEALTTAVSLAPADPEALYYLGTVQLQLDKDGALDTLKSVKGDVRFTHVAQFTLGREALRAGDYASAVALLTEAANGWSRDPVTMDYLALAMRLAGTGTAPAADVDSTATPPVILSQNEKEEKAARRTTFASAAEARATALAAEPLDVFAAVEGVFAPGKYADADIRAAIGKDSELYLETALFYSSVGIYKDALAVAKAGIPTATSGLYYYHLAYFADKAGDAALASEYSAKAREMGPDFVFPHRPEDVLALESTAAAGDAAYPRFYAGTMLYWLGRPDAAVTTWESLLGKSDIPGLYRNVARAYSQGNLSRVYRSAIDLYVKAVKEDPQDIELYFALDDLYTQIEDDRRGSLLESGTKLFPENDQMALRMAVYLVDEHRYGDARDILENHEFHKSHQSRELIYLGRRALTETYSNLAMEALRNGERDKALDLLNKAANARATLRNWFD